MKYRYPFLDLREVNEPWMKQLQEKAAEVIASGRYIGGPEVSEFEAKLAGITGTEFAVGCGNGLDAIRLIFRALIETGRLRKGDEVVVPSNTYIASVLAVTDCGLKPVFVEPDERTMNLSGEGLRKALTTGIKAVLTVHLYGRPAYDSLMEKIVREHELLLVEDNAQAIGARAFDGRATGSLGVAGAFSFYPTKNIGALGDAGAVTTSDPELAEVVRALGNYGSTVRYRNDYQGLNSRMDPLQAAFLNLKLDGLQQEIERRWRIATIYENSIHNGLIVKPLFDDPGQVWHQYVLQVRERDLFREDLVEFGGIQTDVHYPTPPHLQPCYREYAHLKLPVAERLAAEVVSLPISACTSEADAAEIASLIDSFCG